MYISPYPASEPAEWAGWSGGLAGHHQWVRYSAQPGSDRSLLGADAPYPSVRMTEKMPVAPDGWGGLGSAIWRRPSPSRHRTAKV